MCSSDLVIARTVSLDAGKLSEIVNGMTAIRRAAADAEQEQPPAALAQGGKAGSHPFECRGVKDGDDLTGFLKVLLRVRQCRVGIIKQRPRYDNLSGCSCACVRIQAPCSRQKPAGT